MNTRSSPTAAAGIPDEGLLELGSDLHLRQKWFLPASFSHPAKLHLDLLHWIVERYTRPEDTIADPMCGIGSILYAATLQRQIIAREIEPRWLEIAYQNASHIMRAGGLFVGRISVGQQDAREPWGYQADHVVFSPPYGNETSTTPNKHRALLYKLESCRVETGSRFRRLADHPTDGAMGMIAFHYGNHPAQMGHFRGRRYWQAMTEIYANAYQALGHGYLILILKDHIANGKRVRTAEQTIQLCQQLGFAFVAWHRRRLSQLSFWQRRRKEAGLPVVEEEDILVFRRPLDPILKEVR